MRQILHNSRRILSLGAKSLYSRETFYVYSQAITHKKYFSILGSHVHMKVSSHRNQEALLHNQGDDNIRSGVNPLDKVGISESEGGFTALNTASEAMAQQILDDPAACSDDYLTTIFENLEPYIDTYEVYTQLIKSGFSPSQSDEIINLLVFQLNTKLTKLSTIYSQLYELENEQYLFESAKQELHVDITRNREQHINDAINQINAMERDYSIISDELNNQFIQMKNDIQVAINDQKSENTLMSKKIMLRMQETNHKITTELNMAMRSEVESLRWHLSRWGLIAIMMSIVTASAGFYIYRSRHQKQMTEKNEFIPLVIYEPSEFDEDDYHADLDPNAL